MMDDENYHRYNVTGARECDKRFHAISLVEAWMTFDAGASAT
jgi:hypothetical protein